MGKCAGIYIAPMVVKKPGFSTSAKNIGDKLMKPEYDISQMKSRPNPLAKGVSYQELINLYLQDCVTSQRQLSVD